MSAVLPSGFVRNPNLHAYMFVSPDAASRREVSRRIAKSILCRDKNDNAEPCEKCDCCIKMDAKTHPDCIVIGADEKTGVDDIRSIVSEAYLATNEADFKVFILEDADEYNVQSQNALLKIIEEPPQGVKFILTASSQGAILPTVRSRVCSVSGSVRDIESIIAEVKKSKPSLSDEQIKTLSYFVEGYEKADIKNLDEAKIFDYVNKAQLYLSAKDSGILMSLPIKREELMLCLQVFMLSVRQLALSKATGRITEGVLDSTLFSQCNAKVSMKRAHALYDLFEESYLLAEGYANVNAVLGYLFENVR
ncbi:MAG: hypothetical protein IJW06_03455 [Clostridia bacterium]|nr:hypothetical protein [Clostridia bacterium]